MARSPSLLAASAACGLLAAILLVGVAPAGSSVLLGGRCNNTANCSVQFSACVYNVCHCENGRVANTYGDICLLEAQNVNDSCSENAQCSRVANTVCTAGRCACAAGYVLQYGSCVLPANPPGGGSTPGGSPLTCSSDRDCSSVVRNSECRSGVCQCKRGYQLSPDRQRCSAGAVLRSLVAVVALGLLLVKVTA
ncbi:integrin beta-2-like [Bacillus rossius redtenbacheri]|uniref:integrin beta-2-like n=1 Tax=Bacillus rossius redtenbacheri TaxID=93214 RepID=UPI002FDE28D0